MEDVITQAKPDGGGPGRPLLPTETMDYADGAYSDDMSGFDYGNSLIHLNIQENHYYITRDQLMALPESLLLCLFPSGVFLDKNGQVITNLTPDDEVFITNFPPECFEYIMEVYSKAYEDLVQYPVEQFFDKSANDGFISSAKEFLGLVNNNNTGSNNSPATSSSEHEILHNKPAIIVLREDLDYYCVPQHEFTFHDPDISKSANQVPLNSTDPEAIQSIRDDLLRHFMAQVKIAAGSYLTSKTSIFQGLYSSNRLKYQNTVHRDKSGSSLNNSHHHKKRLGPAEQHLMDMLCTSGFHKNSTWGNRTQETGKTVISSLSLCRLENESTDGFRKKYKQAKLKWERERKGLLPRAQSGIDIAKGSGTSLNPGNKSLKNNGMTSSKSFTHLSKQDSMPANALNEKKKSKISSWADNLGSSSKNSSKTKLLSHSPSFSKKNSSKDLPGLYDLVPRPDINAKLLLFWRKPARKCWWGEEEVEVEVEIYGKYRHKGDSIIELRIPKEGDPNDGLNKINVKVKLHIRRVWTLELSIIGVQ